MNSAPNAAQRAIIKYEYRIQSTPEFILMDDDWELYDVKYMYLPNGAFNFIAIFRRQLSEPQSHL